MSRRAALALAAAVIALATVGAFAYRHWRAADLLERAKAAFERGASDEAGRLFALSLSLSPDQDEALLGLGACEAAAGRPDAALDALGRIKETSPYGPAAAVRMAPLLLDRGRHARAEEVLRAALRRPGDHADEANDLLGRALRFQGRRDEARDLLARELRTASDPVRVLRSLWMLDFEALAVDRTRALLDQAARDAPDDDRVRLGLANLDRRSGRLDDADRALSALESGGHDDPAVARARLDWAVAAGRPDEALRALPRAGDLLREADLLALAAWLARTANDPDAERAALGRLIDRSPAAPGALERLADLEAQAGKADAAAELRRRKAALDDARQRYHRHFLDDGPRLGDPENAAALAALAEALDRPIEARGWWSIRLRARPTDQKARDAIGRLDAEAARERAAAPATLADLLRARPAAVHAAADDAPTTPVFRDLARAAGLDVTFDQGLTEARQLPETMSGGVALLDYDGDGRLDVYAIQGGPLVPTADRPSPGDRLFRNRGDGTFEDATERAGIGRLRRGYGHGAAVADIDNDGDPDLFLTRFGAYALYRNNGDGSFEDATDAAGLGGPRGWPTSAAFADLDGDGDPDLYVCQYLRWDPAHPVPCRDPETGRPTYCEPRAFEAEPDRLFRNDNGVFVDVTGAAGIVDRDGRGLGVVAADLDGDGKTDLFVANDTTANLAFFNQGSLTFREAGLEAGLAANAESGFLAGMGVAAGDVDGDGRVDLAVTNFYDESTTVYLNLGGGQFADRSASVGSALPSRYLLGFGAAFLDYDRDGRTDLVTANGHVNDSRPLYPYAMPMQLLAGVAKGRLRDATPAAGPPLTDPRLGRGLATGDLDDDGRTDLVVVGLGAPLAYLHNETPGGRGLTIALEGAASGRDAVGARVVATAGGVRRVGWRTGGGSYLSASDPRLVFGFGPAGGATTATVEVAWPSGRVDRFDGLALDRGHRLREGDPTPRPLPGPARAVSF